MWCSLFLLVPDGAANAQGEPADVVVRLLPETSQIRQGDPLFIKVLIENPTGVAVHFDRPIGTAKGTLQFELRRPNGNDFKKVNARGQGSAYAGLGRKRSRVLGPHQTYIGHEVLFIALRTPVFSDAGIHEVRARIYEDGGISGMSQPISILVSEASSTSRPITDEIASVLYDVIGPMGIAHVDRHDLQGARDRVGQGILGRTLDWVIAVLQVREAHTPAERSQAQERLRAIRLAAFPLTQEFITLVLAKQWLEMEAIEEAQREVESLPNNSFEKDELLHTIREHIREKQDAPQPKEAALTATHLYTEHPMNATSGEGQRVRPPGLLRSRSERRGRRNGQDIETRRWE
jgi:hypothetical protein